MPVIFYKNKAYGIGIVSGTVKSVNGKTPDAANNVTIDGGDIVKDVTLLGSPTLREALDDEVIAREGADTTLQSNLDTEVTAREDADTILQGNIDTVQSNLDTEVTAREDADSTLQTNINGEEASREHEDLVLHDLLDDEATARETGDTNTLNSAKDYADTGDETTLTNSKSYTDTQIENAELSKQTWLPAVQTLSELEAITPPEPDKTNYLCRVMNDTDKDNNGVWQWIAGATAWSYFSDNLDFVDEDELNTAIDTEKEVRENADTTLQTNIDNKADKFGYYVSEMTITYNSSTQLQIDKTHKAGDGRPTKEYTVLINGGDNITFGVGGTPANPILTLNSNDDTKVDKVSTNSKVYGTSSTGEQTTYDVTSFGMVNDVKVDGTTVVTDKVANIDLTGKVDKETGKGLSSNDFTDGDKAKVDDIATLQTAITKLNTVYTCPVANIPFNTTNFEIMADGITDGKTFLLRRNGKICTISMDVKSKIEFAINTNIKVAMAMPAGYSPVTGAKAPAIAYLTDGATAYAGNIRYTMNTGQCYFFFGGTPFPAGGRIFCNVTYVTNDDYPSS
jgi:hypothetical protein